MTQDRWTLVEKAKICQDSERWDDMAKLMKALVTSVTELQSEERNMLSLAYKNVVGAKRSSWRVISSIEKGLEGNQRKKQLCKDYRIKIEHELTEWCTELLKLVERLLNNTGDNESRIFYLKLKGDYFRYIAEFNRYGKLGDVSKLAKQAYEEALAVAKENVSPAHPIRLGLILNLSVFYYEILNLQGAALDLARDAQKLAANDLDNIKEESRNDSALILEFLNDNVCLWTVDPDDEIPRGKSVR